MPKATGETGTDVDGNADKTPLVQVSLCERRAARGDSGGQVNFYHLFPQKKPLFF